MSSFRMEYSSGPGGGKLLLRHRTPPGNFSHTPHAPQFTEVSVHGPLGKFVRHQLRLTRWADTEQCYICQSTCERGKSLYACTNPECDLHVCVPCGGTTTHLVIWKRKRSTTPVLSETSTTAATTAAQVTRERSVTPVMPQA
jgi:hypothetical protein